MGIRMSYTIFDDNDEIEDVAVSRIPDPDNAGEEFIRLDQSVQISMSLTMARELADMLRKLLDGK